VSDESGSDIANGGGGSDWKEGADSGGVQSQTSFYLSRLQGPKRAHLEVAPPVSYFWFFFIFYSEAAASKRICITDNNYGKKIRHIQTFHLTPW
jgi:hypothetical protein